jgi:anti-sigma B factor antagonist
MPADPNTAASRLALAGELTIYRAAELKGELMLALARAPLLELDLSAVSELDTAGLQVLMLAKQHATALGHQLRLVGHSAAVLEIFDMLDLGGYFGDALLVSAAH